MLGNTNIKTINVHVTVCMYVHSTRVCKISKSLISDFGIPKMYVTSPNKKEHTHRGRDIISLFTGYLQNGKKNQFKEM